MLEELKKRVADALQLKGIAFDTKTLEEAHILNEVAIIFSNVLMKHDMVTLTGRRITNFCIKHRVTKNEEIHGHTKVIVQEIIDELQKNVAVNNALFVQRSDVNHSRTSDTLTLPRASGIQLNPFRVSYGDASEFKLQEIGIGVENNTLRSKPSSSQGIRILRINAEVDEEKSVSKSSKHLLRSLQELGVDMIVLSPKVEESLSKSIKAALEHSKSSKSNKAEPSVSKSQKILKWTEEYDAPPPPDEEVEA